MGHSRPESSAAVSLTGAARHFNGPGGNNGRAHRRGALNSNPGSKDGIDPGDGLEHLSRGTARAVDTLLVVLEPYYKSMETARRCADLGRELGIVQVVGVANKFRGNEDRAAILSYAAAHGLILAGEVPFDDAICQADLAGLPPALSPDTPAGPAIEILAAALIPANGQKSQLSAVDTVGGHSLG